jgi:predicted regulator of Ras-like GTPase activity (Roadblock/LC7/MglB family)
VTLRGLERHPHNADAHDLLARIAVDRGELQRAFDEWDMVLRLVPTHIGARKGMGFVCFRQGRVAEAERYLGEAAAGDPDDDTIAVALAHIRAGAPVVDGTAGQLAAPAGDGPRPLPASPRMLFADLIGEAQQTVLLLDAQGLVMAGAYVDAEGNDVAEEVGAHLSGVSEEARRAMRHLGLGDWNSITFETEAAVIAMAPAPQDALLLVAAARNLPLGLVGRLRERSLKRAASWMGEA